MTQLKRDARARLKRQPGLKRSAFSLQEIAEPAQIVAFDWDGTAHDKSRFKYEVCEAAMALLIHQIALGFGKEPPGPKRFASLFARHFLNTVGMAKAIGVRKINRSKLLG